jgi:hypothetical protein
MIQSKSYAQAIKSGKMPLKLFNWNFSFFTSYVTPRAISGVATFEKQLRNTLSVEYSLRLAITE